MISKHLIRALLLPLLFSFVALAQTPGATPQTDEQRKAQKALEAKALDLLDDVIKESESFKQVENTVRIKAAAAYILWKYDEPRARILFKEATVGLIDLLNSREAGEQAEGGKLFEGPKQLRAEMLVMLAQRDARLAREFMRATRPAASQADKARRGFLDEEVVMDMNLAIQIASSDPKLAVEIGQEQLSKRLSFQLPELVSAVQAKDPEAAARLASDIMTRLRTEKLESSGEARQIAVNLLNLATKMPEGEAKEGAKDATPLLDQAAIRELTELISAEALRASSRDPQLLFALQSMMPVIEKYAPTRAEQLRKKMPKAVAEDDGEDVEDELGLWSKYEPLVEKGNVDEMLAAAPKAPQAVRDMLYQSAATKLLEEGNTERARQIVNEKVQDPAQRKAMLDQLDKAAMAAAAEQGKIEQARKAIVNLRTGEERAMALAQLATTVAAKGDKKSALQLLEEARNMVSLRAKNVQQLGAQLVVARAYAPLDPARSLAMLEPIADQLNELLAAATVLGGFFVEEIVRDDEVMLGPIMMLLNLSSHGFLSQYLGDIVTLARADFDRTKGLADKFLRPEIRTMVRLLLVQSILSPPEQTHMMGKPASSPFGVVIYDTDRSNFHATTVW